MIIDNLELKIGSLIYSNMENLINISGSTI